MILKDGRITLLINREGTKIELYDAESSTTFATVNLTPEQLTQALSRLGYTHCMIEVNGLHKVGKKMEHKKWEFELPKGKAAHLRHKRKELYDWATKICPEGWEPDLYFDAQDSFFVNEEGKDFARTIVRRWV